MRVIGGGTVHSIRYSKHMLMMGTNLKPAERFILFQLDCVITGKKEGMKIMN